MDEINASDIQRILEEEYESDLPDTVLEVFRRNEGKRLTKHLLKQLPGGEEEWRLLHAYGSTVLETWSYRASSTNKGFHFTLSNQEKNVDIDSNALQQRNPAYFAARVERNAKRLEAKSDQVGQELMANYLNVVIEAREALARAEKHLSDYIHRTPFIADAHRWNQLAEGKDK